MANTISQACKRYSHKNCGKRFADRTGKIVMGRRQPLSVWLAYLEDQADSRYLLAPDTPAVLVPSGRPLADQHESSNSPLDHPNIAPLGAPLFEENPHVRQDS